MWHKIRSMYLIVIWVYRIEFIFYNMIPHKQTGSTKKMMWYIIYIQKIAFYLKVSKTCPDGFFINKLIEMGPGMLYIWLERPSFRE